MKLSMVYRRIVVLGGIHVECLVVGIKEEQKDFCMEIAERLCFSSVYTEAFYPNGEADIQKDRYTFYVIIPYSGLQTFANIFKMSLAALLKWHIKSAVELRTPALQTDRFVLA